MKHYVMLCDKCGKVIEYPNTIYIKYANTKEEFELSLCNNCFKVFYKLMDKFRKSKNECNEYNEYQLARHILKN